MAATSMAANPDSIPWYSLLDLDDLVVPDTPDDVDGPDTPDDLIVPDTPDQSFVPESLFKTFVPETLFEAFVPETLFESFVPETLVNYFGDETPIDTPPATPFVARLATPFDAPPAFPDVPPPPPLQYTDMEKQMLAILLLALSNLSMFSFTVPKFCLLFLGLEVL